MFTAILTVGYLEETTKQTPPQKKTKTKQKSNPSQQREAGPTEPAGSLGVELGRASGGTATLSLAATLLINTAASAGGIIGPASPVILYLTCCYCQTLLPLPPPTGGEGGEEDKQKGEGGVSPRLLSDKPGTEVEGEAEEEKDAEMRTDSERERERAKGRKREERMKERRDENQTSASCSLKSRERDSETPAEGSREFFPLFCR